MKKVLAIASFFLLVLVGTTSASNFPYVRVFDVHYPDRTDGIVCGFYVAGFGYSHGLVTVTVSKDGQIIQSAAAPVEKDGHWQTLTMYPVVTGKLVIVSKGGTSYDSKTVTSKCTSPTDLSPRPKPAPTLPDANFDVTMPPTDTE